MNQTHNDTFSNRTGINADMKSLLEALPEGACIIGPDHKIVYMNARLRKMLAKQPSGSCHEALAGIRDNCPFCPFDEMLSGKARPVSNAIHIRWGKTCSVHVAPMREEGQTRFLLETVRDLTDEIQDSEQSVDVLPQNLLKKLTGLLLISRGLMGNAPFTEKIETALKRVIHSFGVEAGVRAWAVIDNRQYGLSVPGRDKCPVLVQDIKVEGKTRGSLSASFNENRTVRAEEKYFFEEVADLIGRQVEITDLWGRLKHSEEKYKKLAGNLTKEMWSRTEALVKETGYLEGILRCSEDMIITTDLESRIVQFNPGAEKMLGYTAEEIQGRKISEVWINAEERDKLMEDVILSGGIRNYQTVLRTKSGNNIEISLSLSLLKDEENQIIGTVGVSKDIGRENAVRRELERVNQNFREAIHFINHETKNSLVVMGGFLRRLLQSEQDEQRKDQLRIVYHHAKFLEAMSRDFLVMAELEHGEFQTRMKLIRSFYNKTILPAMIGLKERYPDSFESYDNSMGGVGDISVYGDPALLEIVYRNLFGNALKYRYPDKKIAFGVVEHPDKYVFNVWNEGPGVPLDQVEKIFEKFYRVHDETTREKRGTGLGLYNIRRIIEAHGGKIWCETKPGEWINFLFELPKHIVPAEEVHHGATEDTEKAREN